MKQERDKLEQQIAELRNAIPKLEQADKPELAEICRKDLEIIRTEIAELNSVVDGKQLRLFH